MYKKFQYQGYLYQKKVKKIKNKIVNVMKVSILLLFAGALSISASVYSQDAKVTIKLQDKSVNDVIVAIKAQTNYSFWYDINDVDGGQHVSLDVEDQTVKDVLIQTLKEQEVEFGMYGNHIIIVKKGALASLATLQDNVITGTVTEADDVPLPGVSVALKGTTRGTITDANGSYSINVPDENAVLEFSFVGYATQEIKVGSQRVINVTLSETARLIEEVVVVGYGTQKKANLTGAVDQIDGKALENRPVRSAVQALQGAMGNLNIFTPSDVGTGGGGSPATRMVVNIRGVTSVNSGGGFDNGSPLIVVDGIQGQDINMINPNDIESVSILKDAASSAIYGSNAPYGVILITTKKGKKEAKPTITYSVNMGWSSAIFLPEQVPSVEWAKLMNEVQQNTTGTNFLKDENMQRIQDYYDGKITTSTVPNPGMFGDQSYAMVDDYGQGLCNDNNNWYDIYFKNNAFSQQHNLGLQGGTQNINYYVGLGYNHKDGLLKWGGDSYDRYSIRANLSSEITRWLTTNVRWAYAKGIHDRPSNTGNDNFMQQIAFRWPILPLKLPNGIYSRVSNIPMYTDGGRWVNNENTNTMTGEFVITPLKGWNTTMNYTYTTNQTTVVRNTTSFKLIDAWGEPYYFPGWASDGFDQYSRGIDNLYRERADEERHTINAYTSYELDISGHYLKGMVGFTQESIHIYGLAASSGNVTLFSTDIPTFGNFYYETNNQTITEPYKGTLATRGVFGRINYGYKDRYLLEVSGRYDGTSRYMKDVRFKFYPGVSAAWVISKEDFYGESLQPYVGFLKIRASYGSLGEQSGGYYPFYPSVGIMRAGNANWLFDGVRRSAVSYPAAVNPNLTWVTSTTLDFGLDASFLKERMTIAFDWYDRVSSDIVGPPIELPAVLGTTAAPINNAELRTKGFELTLGWRDRIPSIGLEYGIRVNLANSKGVVTKFANESKSLSNWYEGAVVGDIWGYVTDGYYTFEEQVAGIDQNVQGNGLGPGVNWTAGDIKYKDLNDDGLITRGTVTVDDPGDRQIIGNFIRKYPYGINFDASWKNFDIGIFIQGIGKRDAVMNVNNQGQFWGSPRSSWEVNWLTIHRDRWTPETPNGYFPKFYFDTSRNLKNMQEQTKYLQNAAYVRVKNLQIGYTLPASLLNKVGIAKTRIYVSGENLLTFTKMVKTIDPELATIDRGLGYPMQRTWSVGLSMSL